MKTNLRFAPNMSAEERANAWKESEKLIAKGKTEGALELLREIDPQGDHHTTLRIAASAIFVQASKANSKSLYRKAAKLTRDSLKINPKDKQTNALYNQIRNEMQDKSISETLIPKLMNESGPTPAGLFAIVASLILLIAGLTSTQSAGDSEQDVLLEVRWTDRSGIEHNGSIWISLYDDDAPMHAESFRANVDKGRYDGVPFHRIVDEFMIQGGDFVNHAGSGGYAGAYFGYCSTT